jgi:uncharacterized coiled-coil protein SlyX
MDTLDTLQDTIMETKGRVATLEKHIEEVLNELKTAPDTSILYYNMVLSEHKNNLAEEKKKITTINRQMDAIRSEKELQSMETL